MTVNEAPHALSSERTPSEAVDRGAVEAIVTAGHGNPFAVLGPHPVDYHDDAVIARAETVHPSGFHVARVDAGERPGYRVKVTKDGFSHVFHDPYALGSALADYDIAAITHSNDTVYYYIFGAHPITHGGLGGMRFVVWAPKM